MLVLQQHGSPVGRGRIPVKESNEIKRSMNAVMLFVGLGIVMVVLSKFIN
jgi:hypothetical protein